MLIDTHCHLTFPELRPQIDEVVRRAAEAGVERMITVATSIADARDAVGLMQDHGPLWLTAGIHPHEAAKVSDDELAALSDLHHGRWDDGPARERLVAVGETGLDFHYDFAPADVQERVFRYQLKLACEVGRPVVIHARQAEERVCDILADYPVLRERVVFHCFSGTADLAQRIVDMGFWLSYTGVVTFARSDSIREAARITPADRIMVETDAPYLSPAPYRKQRPNEPALVVHTARALAEARGVGFEAFAQTTTQNAIRFFHLPVQEHT